jgi:hypothetical protein
VEVGTEVLAIMSCSLYVWRTIHVAYGCHLSQRINLWAESVVQGQVCSEENPEQS